MPELPEVESAREYLESAVLCQPIQEVLIRDERILSQVTPVKLNQCLTGKIFRSVQRHGKRLFLELEEDLWLTLSEDLWRGGTHRKPLRFPERGKDRARCSADRLG